MIRRVNIIEIISHPSDIHKNLGSSKNGRMIHEARVLHNICTPNHKCKLTEVIWGTKTFQRWEISETSAIFKRYFNNICEWRKPFGKNTSIMLLEQNVFNTTSLEFWC